MTPFYADDTVTIHHGDCLDVLPTLPDASVDAVVTDPPYGLAEISTAMVLQAIAAWMQGDRSHVPDGRGFMGCDWDRFVPPPGVWDECMRVLKPGGHLLAFAAPRTVDLMGLSIRIAGFDVRDSIDWIFSQGFPKSLDVSKAIDKAAGAVREVVGEKLSPDGVPYSSRHGARSGRSGGGIMGEAVPVSRSSELLTVPATDDARRWNGWGTALKPAHEPIVVARKPLAGTVAGNVLERGTGALNIDACRVGDEVRINNAGGTSSLQRVSRVEAGYRPNVTTSVGQASQVTGRWPTNIVLTHSASCDGECAPDCPVAELDRQSGVRPSGGSPGGESTNTGMRGNTFTRVRPEREKDTGGASRYFPVFPFRYEAKAKASERPRGEDGTAHVTVKPLELMRWLVRLVTPPGGVVLDPFLGSGTTAEACVIEGVRCIGVERDEAHLPLIKARLAKPIQPTLGFEAAS